MSPLTLSRLHQVKRVSPSVTCDCHLSPKSTKLSPSIWSLKSYPFQNLQCVLLLRIKGVRNNTDMSVSNTSRFTVSLILVSLQYRSRQKI